MPEVKSVGQTIRGLKDVISQPLYDTLTIANGDSGDKVFFQNPISATKSLFKTNMRQSGEIPRGQVFYLHGFSIAIQSTQLSPADANNLLFTSESYFTFTLLDKKYFEIPIYFIPIFHNYFAQDTTNFVVRNFHNIPYLKLGKIITIKGKENFSMVLRIENAITLTASIDLTVFLHGNLSRNVQ